MIDISFLSQPTPLKLRSGMEYLEWQNKDFFNALSQFFKACNDEVTETPDSVFSFTQQDGVALATLIKQRTGITVVVDTSTDHFAIRNGYISPNHLLNRKGVEARLSASHSVMGETFRWLNTQALTGRCDLKTGKVEGDFQNVVFQLRFGNQDVANFQKQTNTSVHDQLAAAILHELGHAFFSLYYLSQTVIDNLLLAQVVKYFKQEHDVSRRVTVARQLKAETDISLPSSVIQQAVDEDTLSLGFETGRKERDTRRTLSLGLERITGEALADIYAVRMGASLALVDSVISTLPASVKRPQLLPSLAAFYLLRNWWVPTPVSAVIAIIPFAMMALRMITNPWSLVSKGTYDTPYRRLKATLRENIAYLNSLSPNDAVSPAQKAQLIAEAKHMDSLIEKQKPFFESTMVQRLLGLLHNGTDTKKMDFEYFTAELAAPALSLYTLLPSSL